MAKLMSLGMVICLVSGMVRAIDLPVQLPCSKEHPSSGLSSTYYENVAHAIHSMTVQTLRMFNPKATVNNKIPTVNLNVSSTLKVLSYAPEDPTGHDFSTPTMNVIDKILANVGKANDGLGPYWSPVERVAHSFHMLDLLERVRQEYSRIAMWSPPKQQVCDCLLRTDVNGIGAGVAWVAQHYEHGTPITLLGRPIPKLTDAASWAVWKERLLHYYTVEATYDAALFMYCATIE